jgi:hypothetical protein
MKLCVSGMVGSDEFSVQMFDALARRRGIVAQVLTKDELREFWEQLSDPGFDAKLQTFFDMYVCLQIQIQSRSATLPVPF